MTEILTLVSYVYFVGCVILVMWQAYVMRTKIDWNERRSDIADIMMEFIVAAVIWPILIAIKPSRLFRRDLMFNKNESFLDLDKIQKNHNDRLKALVQLAQSPPPCGKKLLLKYQCQYSSEADEAVDIIIDRERLRYVLNTEPQHAKREEVNAIRSWLKNIDDSVDQPTMIPQLLSLDEAMFSLLKEGHAEVFCKECVQLYDVTSMKQYRPKLHNGWNTETYSCPRGHEVINHDWIHVQMRRVQD